MAAQGPSPVLVIAHRGASAARPENTMEAFAEAMRMGADGVELDVRRGADGALVVHHDADIAGVGPIDALGVADLPDTVPLLDAVLEMCAPMRVINVEIKTDGADPDQATARAVAALVAERRLVANVLVSSFDLGALDSVRSAEPDIRTGLLVPVDFDARRAVARAAERGHVAVHPFFAAVDPDVVADAHAVGLAVNTWTVDDPDEIRRLAALGVDGVITNRPDVALAALGGR